MSGETRTPDDGMPGDSDLEEPSTEKEPDQEPTATDAHDTDAEPSHRAVGLGVSYEEPAPQPGDADDAGAVDDGSAAGRGAQS